jgi:CubicO group peptidase (beta-lactamase class C family)
VRTQTTNAEIEDALAHARELGEIGIQVAAYVGDELVLDTWTGEADAATGRPVDGETVFNVFSVSKGVTALAVHLQVQRGLLDYDAPLAEYWPEYGTRGKEAVTVRHVLTHRAGVPQMPADTTPERIGDWAWMIGQLEQVEPAFPPGTDNAYLSYSSGWLLGEVVRRTDPAERPFGRFVAEELCAPLRADAFWIGLPGEEEHRVAPVSLPVAPARAGARRSIAVPPAVEFVPEVYNRPEVRQACIPATGGIGNARSVARLFSVLAGHGQVDGVRFLGEETIETFFTPRPDNDKYDEYMGGVVSLGLGGFYLDTVGMVPPPPSARVLCSAGAGETLAVADLASGLSFAICHNRMVYGAEDRPFAALSGPLWRLAGRAS